MASAIPSVAELTKQLAIVFGKPTPKLTRAAYCCRCASRSRLHRHHVTYIPEKIVMLCWLCHSRVTGLNTKGSLVAGGNKITRTDYTNKLRLVLWEYFMKTPWPTGKRRMSKTDLRVILHKLNFKIELNSSKTRPCSREPSNLGLPQDCCSA
jgi:hypothetical protein